MTQARPVRLKSPLLGFVCRKCARKAGDRKPGKRLTRALRDATGTKVQAGEIACLKLCPKRHIVVVLAGGEARLVPRDGWVAASVGAMAPARDPGPPTG